ncbi:MAG: hypothetical protein ACRD9R_06785 [Pyrinomonadaceae bacterium]
MTLPPQGSQQYELRRRIVGCRERLRRGRTAPKIAARDTATMPSGQRESLSPPGTPELPAEEGRRTRRAEVEFYEGAKDDVAA